MWRRGDFRPASLSIINPDGTKAFDPLFVERHDFITAEEAEAAQNRIYGIDFPHLRKPDQGFDLVMEDPVTHLRVVLHYDVFKKFNLLQRSTTVINNGNAAILVQKVSSFTLDIPTGKDFDYIHFHGHHASERLMERGQAPFCRLSLESRRGLSSHHENPTLLLAEKGTDEVKGECYLFSMVYSGDFFLECFREAQEGYRVNGGISPETFSLTLQPGERFTTPAAILCYSPKGFSFLSRQLHEALKEHLIPSGLSHRPVLLNSWEGAMMDFDAKRIESMAEGAKKMGCDLFVLDDGWFKGRSDDKGGLGDWIPDETKLGGSFDSLAKKIQSIGMSFGLWFEPEMVSEDSELFRTHPEYVLTIPGRKPNISRGQLVLDMSRKEVQDYLFEKMSGIIRESHIVYLKWDFNRAVCDLYSEDSERLRRLPFLFMMGTYSLLGRIRRAFPKLLIETCAGGGGRFDLGLLYFTPQIWCSDNTDFDWRAKIQYGTSFLYPPSAMGSHISKSPNPATKRKSTLMQRFEVAIMGSYGYELDPAEISEAEKKRCKRLSERFQELEGFFENADFLRLSNPFEDSFFAYEFISKDRKKAFVSVTQLYGRKAVGRVPVKLLSPKRKYRCGEQVMTGEEWMAKGIEAEGICRFSKAGDALFVAVP